MKWRSGVRDSNDRCIQDQGECFRTLYIQVTPITFLSPYSLFSAVAAVGAVKGMLWGLNPVLLEDDDEDEDEDDNA